MTHRILHDVVLAGVGAGLLAMAVVHGPRDARAQLLPAGSEFQVNTYTTFAQREPSVAADADGDFVVVWYSDEQDGDQYGVFGQRYSSAGSAVGGEFQVNVYTPGNQETPAVAMESNGDFVVVWSSVYGPDGYGGIFGRRFSSAGTALGGDFEVSTYTADEVRRPAVAMDANGDFVAVWETYSQDGSNTGIFGQRFSTTGSAVGGEFQINTYTTNYQRLPAVATEANGDFVVVWESNNQDGSGRGIFGRRFASAGTAIGGEFQVNTYTTALQSTPSVAADSDGDFIVVWVGHDPALGGVRGQRFSNAGAMVGAEFQVNTYTTGQQASYPDGPVVAADADGDFVVAWRSYQDGSQTGIFGQYFGSAGSPVGTEFQVNTYTTNFQFRAAVAADAGGDFVVVWSSFSQDGGSYGAFGQRYAGTEPPLPIPMVSAVGLWLTVGLLGGAMWAMSAMSAWRRRGIGS